MKRQQGNKKEELKGKLGGNEDHRLARFHHFMAFATSMVILTEFANEQQRAFKTKLTDALP